MKVPTRGHREVAAAWIAVSVAVVTVIAGTAATLAIRADLPNRLVVRRDPEGTPKLMLDLGGFLVAAAFVTLGACLLAMAVDLALRRAPRAETSALAAALPACVGPFIYGAVLAQRGSGDPPIWPLLSALALGTVVGLGLYWWARPLRAVADPDGAILAPLLEVPGSARLAWVGRSSMTWPIRLGQVSTRLIAPALMYWWFGLLQNVWFVLVVVPLLFLPGTRARQLVVDYSGVGMRGGGGRFVPSPVPLAQVRSAEATTISALRDFGGWGRRKRPGGEDAWIGRSGEALVVHRIGKPDVTFTVDGAEEAAAVLNTHIARYRAWAAENQSFTDLPAPYGDRV